MRAEFEVKKEGKTVNAEARESPGEGLPFSAGSGSLLFS